MDWLDVLKDVILAVAIVCAAYAILAAIFMLA